jgi:hypothetical protein
MSERTTFLDALTQKGVLISVSVRYWRACKKLNAEDLGLSRDQVDDRLISLGHKRLLPQQALKRLSVLESRVHTLVAESTFPFLNGVAHYLPNTKLDDVVAKLDGLRTEFERRRDEFLGHYCELKQSALREWQDTAAGLVDDPERLVAVISNAFPPVDRMDRYFGFDTRLFQITIPEAVPQTQLVDIGTQQAVVEARKDAALTAKEEIERSCQEFIGDCVITLREQTAQLCDEMLGTINGSSSVHQKTLNRLVNFIDRFRELNFINDQEMERQLDAVKQEFLQREAGEYRDNSDARQRLVQGLTRLRGTAAEMATQDARELVQSFGQLGRRRFTLAA